MRASLNMLFNILFSLIIIILIILLVLPFLRIANIEALRDREMMSNVKKIAEYINNSIDIEIPLPNFDISRYDMEIKDDKIILWKCYGWKLYISNTDKKIYRNFTECEKLAEEKLNKKIDKKIYYVYEMSLNPYFHGVYLSKFCRPCDIYQSLGTFYYWEEKGEVLLYRIFQSFSLTPKSEISLIVRIDKNGLEFRNIILKDKK